MNTNKQSVSVTSAASGTNQIASSKFSTEFTPYAWYLAKDYGMYKKYDYINNNLSKEYIKKLAKHTSKFYNLALSMLPLEVLKYVPDHVASTLLNAINYGVFEVDGQKKNFRDFYYYCWSIMSGIDTFIYEH